MKPTPICEIMRRIHFLPAAKKAEKLIEFMKPLPKRSHARRFLEVELKHVVDTDLKRAIKQDNRRTA